MTDFVRTCFQVSIRRACRALPVCRGSYHYHSVRADQASLRKRIREIAETRARYGYRRIHVLLRREGWLVNVKRVHRLYCLEGLQMRHKPPRRRIMAKLRDDRNNASGPNQVWAMDWMYDELFNGKRIWILTVVDTWSRICPVMCVTRSATAQTVIEALERARRDCGLPHTIRVDQGCQFTSKELDLWAYSNGITLDFSRPGKPTDNAFAESFNASVRLECLGQHWFLDMDDAVQKVEEWRRDYNEVRPHSAIGDRPPITLIQKLKHSAAANQKPEIPT